MVRAVEEKKQNVGYTAPKFSKNTIKNGGLDLSALRNHAVKNDNPSQQPGTAPPRRASHVRLASLNDDSVPSSANMTPATTRNDLRDN